MSRPSSRNASRPRTPAPPPKSYERPEAERIISHHAGTVLEDGLESGTAEIREEHYAAISAAFKNEGGGSRLDLKSVKRALLGSGLNLDDALFQRLVESRWEDERGPDGEGVDCEGFVRIYSAVHTPATTFGRHLRKAAGRGDEELVRELILRGCNPNTGSGTGETALHTMAAFGHVDCAKALKALCGKELILQPRDKAGWTPLMVASGNGHTAFMRFLLDEGCDPCVSGESGRTAMHRAAAKGREKALRLLLSKKVKADCRDKCGYTPLHLAAMHDEVAAMGVLLEAGADAGAKDILGYPPKHFCSDRLWQKLVDERGGRGGGRK
eukprot:jgi/Undpi1/11222/HiC_scaffold_30.g13520.m1